MMLYTEERYLLQKLLTEGYVDLFEVYNKTNFSTGQIVRFVNTYTRKLYIISFCGKIYLTPFGRIFIKPTKLLTEKRDMYWKRVPHRMKTKRCNINEPANVIKINRELAKRVISIMGCSRPGK